METNVCVAEEVGANNQVYLFQTCNLLYILWSVQN